MSTEKIAGAEIFSTRLRHLRGSRKKSEFSGFLETTQQNYGRYENGRIPGPDILSKIATRCGVSVDWLLGRTENRLPGKPNLPSSYPFSPSESAIVRENGCRFPADCDLPSQITGLCNRIDAQSDQIAQLAAEVRTVVRLLGGALQLQHKTKKGDSPWKQEQ